MITCRWHDFHRTAHTPDFLKGNLLDRGELQGVQATSWVYNHLCPRLGGPSNALLRAG